MVDFPLLSRPTTRILCLLEAELPPARRLVNFLKKPICLLLHAKSHSHAGTARNPVRKART